MKKTLLSTVLFATMLNAQTFFEYKALEDGSTNGFEMTEKMREKVLATFDSPINSITFIETKRETITIVRKKDGIVLKQKYKSSNDAYTSPKIRKEEF
jgi:hypothetical protein